MGVIQYRSFLLLLRSPSSYCILYLYTWTNVCVVTNMCNVKLPFSVVFKFTSKVKTMQDIITHIPTCMFMLLHLIALQQLKTLFTNRLLHYGLHQRKHIWIWNCSYSLYLQLFTTFKKCTAIMCPIFSCSWWLIFSYWLVHVFIKSYWI